MTSTLNHDTELEEILTQHRKAIIDAWEHRSKGSGTALQMSIDAVLIHHERGDIEYSVVRTGQFSVVPNLIFTIAPNVHGLALEATDPAGEHQIPRELAQGHPNSEMEK